MARGRIRARSLARAAEFRLTPAQFSMLIGLDEASPSSLCALAARVCVDAPTASRVVDALVRRGLVRQEMDAADRRRSIVFPTPDGMELLEQLRPVAEEIRAAVAEGMDAAEEAAFRASLLKVIGNLA